MPGVIMENGDRNGSHTNHDRDRRPNGMNGGGYASEKAQDKGKGRAEPQQMTPTSPTVLNVLNGMANSSQHIASEAALPQNVQDRINQLPPEIAHVTQGYMPLSVLLSRLAQRTHNDLTNKILELAQMPLPASAINGNSSHIASVDDNSTENINRKHRLLEFAQNTHADWTKALVITSWSRNSEDVSKMIDLKIHLDQQRAFYDNAINEMAEVKRSLGYARVPNPDLKTALQVLSTGNAPWMPELNYIEPPPLTAQNLLKTLENLNTLLSIRLNLHEYDSTPLQFKDYVIKSGRVTFRVDGEFEVDLTIADEDPESQFWFIDFRFLFSPSLSELPPYLRFHIESRVNAALLKDGLQGCYKLLHEIVLTHKISEFRRQAVELALGKSIDGLKVELLNRSLSIQYWVDRYGKEGAKSWIILGVHSGRRKDGRSDLKSTSRLSIRWFRDTKEVKDVDIPFDTINISADTLLKTVVAKHVNHILTSIYEKLQMKSIFASNEAALSLSTSSHEPAQSELKVQISSKEHLTISIEPVTGRFIFSPASRMITETEFRFNAKSQDPIKEAHLFIENLRCLLISEDTTNHGLSVGWIRTAGPGLKSDELKPVIPKDTLHVAWFRRPSWNKDWFALLTLGMGGERWWLIESAHGPTGVKVASSLDMRIKGVAPVPTYSFLSRLNVFAAALISHYTNLRALHARRALHTLRAGNPASLVRLPSIIVRLSELIPSKNKSSRTGKAWAKDSVKLTFQGLEPLPPQEQPIRAVPSPAPQMQVSNIPATSSKAASAVDPAKPSYQDEGVIIVTEARMIVPVPAALTILQERVDRDIAFHAKSGTFAFRLRSKVGESVIPLLVERATRVERLVEFVEVLHKHEGTLKCEYISLGKIIFTYRNIAASKATDAMEVDGVGSKSYRAMVDFSTADNVMTLVFDQGNPHLRISDHLTKVLNEKQGLDGVATLLPLTLPALRALDTIEAAWTSLSAKGEVFVFVRAVEWFIVRYNLFSSTADSQIKTRKIMFAIKMQQRRGEPWWYIRRTDTRDKEGDEIDEALRSVWHSTGPGWQGMRANAVAQPSGVENLLRKLDEVLRAVAAVGDGADASPAALQVNPLARASVNATVLQNRQQPTTNSSQSQSQRRNNPVKREIVEID